MHHDVTAGNLREVVGKVELAPESGVRERTAVPGPVVQDRLGERNCKIGVILPGPAACNAQSGQEGVILHPDICPPCLAFVIVDAVTEVHYEVLVRTLPECVLVDARAFRGGELGLDPAVLKIDFIIAWNGFLGIVREPGTVSRILHGAGLKAYLSGSRHHQNVSEVGMPCAAQMSMGESDDCRIPILITCAIPVCLAVVFTVPVERGRLGVGTELDTSVRHAGPRKYVSHAACSNEGVDIVEDILFPGSRGYSEHCQKYCEQLFHIYCAFSALTSSMYSSQSFWMSASAPRMYFTAFSRDQSPFIETIVWDSFLRKSPS